MQEYTHQDVSEIAREARTLAQDLKEAIKKNEVLDRDVEFLRKNLRKQHLKLLLLHPNSKEAKDAETHIWMQTSYHFIAAYKQRITVLDRKLFPSGPQHQKSSSRQDRGGGGHVEYRKLLSRFRQFLAEEEKFYIQLLIRFRSQSSLTEVQPALAKVEIVSAGSEDTPQSDSGRNVFPEQRAVPPKSSDEREARLATFTKLLVCLGDIARYREQFNEGGGRPRAGHEEGSPRKVGRGGKRSGQESLARPRNYSRAQTIYEQARLLVPSDGNASHQLAILSSYQKDTFGSLLHYYRALCVRQPYDTASDNLNTVLKKALDQYRAAKRDNNRNVEEVQSVPKLRVDRFKEWIVVLHGLWYLDSSDGSSARASKHASNIVAEFELLLTDRILPSITVSEIVVLALGALWKLRMIRDSKVRADRKVIEPLMASHILDLSRTLLVMASVQLAEKPEDVQDKEDLAQHITAVFRRMLPAIRIVSKWLRSNLSYVGTLLTSATALPSLPIAIKDFWKAYVTFLTALNETFPSAKLPLLKSPLEEDVDMSGFSPIKKDMFNHSAATENGLAPGHDEVHPNEEYLMRISDILVDAVEVSALEKSPISFINGQFKYRETDASSAEFLSVLAPSGDLASIRDSHPNPPRVNRDSDDENTTQTSRTDDVIREAFNTALDRGTEDDDEEDEIVWSPPKLQLSPQQKVIQPPHSSPQAFTPVQSTANLSPPRAPHLRGPSTSTTAQDLLNNVLGVSRPNNDLAPFTQYAASSTPQASLLFGSGSLNAPTKSIWSNTSGGLNATGVPTHVPIQPSQSLYVAPGHAHSQSLSQPWSSSLSMSQNMQFARPDSLSAPFLMRNIDEQINHQNMAAPNMPHFQAVSRAGYDPHFLRGPNLPVHGQDPRLQGYAGQLETPFTLYDSHANALNAPFVGSVQRTVWDT
ncbi:hypothetical protein M0805_000179 [Coniferiporia weirii]|nr:hypothetical protein M0805_000179 [Coniferiporia weirii]